MKRFILTLSILSSLFPLHSQESFTLSEAITYGVESNRNIKIKQTDILIADQQIKEYKATGMPKVTGSVNYQYYFRLPAQPTEDFLTPVLYEILFDENVIERRDLGPPDVATLVFLRPHNLTGGIDASIMAFDGSYLTGIKAAKLYKELVKKEMDATVEDIRANITKAYMAVLIAEETEKILMKNLENLGKSLEEARILYKEGFTESLDEDRLALSYNNMATQVEKSRNGIHISKNLLKFHMGYPMEKEIGVKEDLELLVRLTQTEIVDLNQPINYRNKAAYEVIEMGMELNLLDMERYRKQSLPSLRLFLNAQNGLFRSNLFNSAEAGFIPSAFGGLGLSIPIYDGGDRQSRIQQAKINADKTEIQLQEYIFTVQMQVTNARLALINARKELDNIQQSLIITERIYDKTQIKFREGVGSSLEVTQAEASLISSQTAYINALYDLISAKTDLDIALGNL